MKQPKLIQLELALLILGMQVYLGIKGGMNDVFNLKIMLDLLAMPTSSAFFKLELTLMNLLMPQMLSWHLC